MGREGGREREEMGGEGSTPQGFAEMTPLTERDRRMDRNNKKRKTDR